jgi:anthranilate synthase component 1
VPDPVALYAHCCDAGNARATALLESADQTTLSGQKSLLMTRASLCITGRGRQVEISALTPNGKQLLSQWADDPQAGTTPQPAARQVVVDRERDASGITTKLRLQYPPPPAAEEQARLTAPGPLDALRSLLAQLRPTDTSEDHPALLIGSLAYDLVAAYEDLPEAQTDASGWPDIEMWLAEQVVWIDHAAGRSTAVCYVVGGEQSEQRYNDATRALTDLIASCQAPPSIDIASHAPSLETSAPQIDMDDDAFMAQVAELKQHIIAGDVFQIVVSRTFSLPCPDPLATYGRLRLLNPSLYGGIDIW